MQAGLTGYDYGSSGFAEAYDFNLEPLLAGADGPAIAASPCLVTLFDLFSY